MVASKVEIITKSYKDENQLHTGFVMVAQFLLNQLTKRLVVRRLSCIHAEDSLDFLKKQKIRAFKQVQQVHAYSIKFGTKTETLPKRRCSEDYVLKTVEDG
jgi:molecular chaperone HtpG